MSRLGRLFVFARAVEPWPVPTAMLCALLAAIAVIFPATSAWPQVPPDLRDAVRAELDQQAPHLPGSRTTGHVTNDSGYRLTNVRLRLEAFDATGQALPPTFGWVDGDVPPHGRAWFRITRPPNAVRLSVSVVDFNLVSIQSP